MEVDGWFVELGKGGREGELTWSLNLKCFGYSSMDIEAGSFLYFLRIPRLSLWRL